MCFLFVFNNTECGVNVLQPLSRLTELQVLYAVRRGNQFYILNILRQCKPVKLFNICNIVVFKIFLYVRVESASLKETIS